MNVLSKLDWIWKEDRKFAIRYTMLFAGGVFSHVMLAALFGIYGRQGLLWGNVGGIGVYVVWALLMIVCGVSDLLLIVPYLDVLVFTGIYNVMLGASAGFYLYTFAMIPATFFFSSRDAKMKHAQVVTAAMALLGVTVMLLTLGRPATAPLASDAQSLGIFQVNLLMGSMLLGMYTWQFLSETQRTQKDLSHIAEYDQLTGVRSRYSLYKLTESIHGTQYCVIMADVDKFKNVNDTYGHAVGDRLLSSIGKTLHSCTRREDIVCRWGGEEFLLVIRSDMDTARTVASRIRRKLTAVAVEVGNDSVSVTMTMGIADCMEADSFEKTAAIADANLLRGKHGGRNCIVCSSDTVADTDSEQQNHTELDTANLDNVIFSAFAATSDTTYVYICNLNTNVSRWSKAAVEYFGLPGEYMYDAGSIWMGFVHPDDRAAYAEDIEAVFSGRKIFHNVTYRARNKNGEYVLCACKGVIAEGEAGQPAMFAGTMTNLGVFNGETLPGR